MSLITRCPTCETMFRVVPDQLRVSEGWVRCGQCAEIFDATQSMVTAPMSEAPVPAKAVVPPAIQGTRPPAPATPPAPVAVPEPAPQPTSQPTFIRPAADAQSAPTEPPEAPPRRAPEPAPRDAPVAGEARGVEAPPTDPETVFLEQDSEGEPSTRPLAQTPTPEIDLPLSALAPEPVIDPSIRADDRRSGSPHHVQADDAPPVSFLRHSEAPSVWSRPAVRWTLLVVLLALLALLVLQIVVKERNRIAALEPATRPVLQALCDITGCNLSPLRQIESIVIDSSTFSRVRGDDYRLGFALRNTAPIAIAMPAIELSLTDPQDQAVIRRVIQPAEFAAGTLSLAKSSVWTGSLAMSVRPGTNTDRIAGYRLLAFYP